MGMSLKTKVSIFITVTIVVISTVSTYLFIAAHRRSMEKGLIERRAALSYALSKAAEEGLGMGAAIPEGSRASKYPFQRGYLTQWMFGMPYAQTALTVRYGARRRQKNIFFLSQVSSSTLRLFRHL